MPDLNLAAIDLGTNSTRLLIARLAGAGLQPLKRIVVVTRLGEGLTEGTKLSLAAKERVLGALREFRQEMRAFNARLVGMVGTSALRRAGNASEFALQVEEVLGIPLEIISGEEEARLTFLGATSFLSEESRVLVIDVGGGSTELIAGPPGAPGEIRSIETGCLTLHERYVRSDPPSQEELAACREAAGLAIGPALREVCAVPPGVAIAVAGTPTSLVAVKMKLEPYDSRLVHGSTLTYEEIEGLLYGLAALPLTERKGLPGLQPGREDVILTGACLLLEIMWAAGIGRLTVSESDLLDGLILTRRKS